VLYSESLEKDWKEKHEDWAKRYRGKKLARHTGRVARGYLYFTYIPKIPVWVYYRGPCNGK
jgi:hypothetical protein